MCLCSDSVYLVYLDPVGSRPNLKTVCFSSKSKKQNIYLPKIKAKIGSPSFRLKTNFCNSDCLLGAVRV